MPKWANAEAGQEVFEATGCIACHNLNEWTGASHLPGSDDRDMAPNLANIGDKIASPGWFFEWVKNPKSYWHETRMPKLNLTDKQAWNVAAYLSSLKSGKDFSQLQPEYKDKYITGKEEEAKKRGATLVKWYGCTGCHEVAGHENDGRIGAELIAFGSKPTQSSTLVMCLNLRRTITVRHGKAGLGANCTIRAVIGTSARKCMPQCTPHRKRK